ncbi:hypothetical protein AB5I41_23610 [Sphingomonas sp. MMS24-JH45]
MRAGRWNGSAFVIATQAATASVSYDAAGNPVSTTDKNSTPPSPITTSWAARWPRSTANFLTEWTRDTNGNVTSERRYAQRVTGATAAVRPGGAAHDDDRVTHFTYDRNGRRASETRVGVEAWAVHRDTGVMRAATADATVRYTLQRARPRLFRSRRRRATRYPMPMTPPAGWSRRCAAVRTTARTRRSVILRRSG